MENVLEIENLSKTYPGFNLNNINLKIPKGTVMGLIGENGAGKSTTIKLILNELNRESGNIKVFGLDNIKDEQKIKSDIGVVLADSFLSEYFNAKDISKTMKQFYNNWDEKLYFNYLKEFNLPDNKQIKDFSTGMKMKLQIITALSHHPKFLILDEPTSGLDPIARNEILDIFRNFIEDDEHSIFISSHITSDLEHIADYITFISEGKIVFTNTCDELLESYGIAKCTKEEFESIEKSDYIRYRENKYDYELLIQDKSKFLKKYGLEVIDKPSLEDIMVIYIKGVKNNEK